ncbi:EI24 domain-containing protein [Leptolyngbya sp. FACHB-671]|uniref:EI24 domain-containing protein n=1 Tax=Leptolyngbya sp. FACHB-671 TaxID=2692812 RepID=UPI001684081C|nr:EI24 domain-containing protein [Leptolyngbya sp. FACHB-671]MBD2070376.1 EI24 domain-containing protein [Leptolyngbya sp. FACHB-671]
MTEKSKPGSELPIIQAPGGLFAGATYPFRALSLLGKTPKLRGYVLVPILVNLIVGGTIYAGLLFAGFQGIDAAIQNLPAWAAFLDVVLRVLLTILLFLLTGFVLLQFGVLLGSPWYGKLSEELEQLRTGKTVIPPGGVGGIFVEIWRAIAFELKKLALTAAIALPLLLLNFAPGVGTVIATVGGIALAATIVCLDFLDPALERRRFRFRTKLGIVARNFPASASFGLICLGLVSIPLINLLAIPLCVTAGTLFFCDRVLPGLGER